MLVRVDGASQVAARGWSWLLHGAGPVSHQLVALQVGVAARDGKDRLLGTTVGVADRYRAGLGVWSLAGSGAAQWHEPRHSVPVGC